MLALSLGQGSLRNEQVCRVGMCNNGVIKCELHKLPLHHKAKREREFQCFAFPAYQKHD